MLFKVTEGTAFGKEEIDFTTGAVQIVEAKNIEEVIDEVTACFEDMVESVEDYDDSSFVNIDRSGGDWDDPTQQSIEIKVYDKDAELAKIKKNYEKEVQKINDLKVSSNLAF